MTIKARNNRFRNYTPFVPRENDTTRESHMGKPRIASTKYTTLQYGVSNHCILRYAQRVLKYFTYVNGAKKITLAQSICNNLDFDMSKVVDGTYPFLDNYQIIIRDNVAITIKEKD